MVRCPQLHQISRGDWPLSNVFVQLTDEAAQHELHNLALAHACGMVTCVVADRLARAEAQQQATIQQQAAPAPASRSLMSTGRTGALG